MPTEHDDELLRRHLLGELPEDESARLEERLLAEDDLFELAEAVEADLAVTPRGRRAAALGRDLATVAAERSAAGAAVLPFRAPPRAPARLLPRLALAAGLAAALLAAAWLVLERGAGREQPRSLRAAAPEAPARPQTDLRRLERGRRGPPGGQVAELPPAPPTPPTAPPGREATAPVAPAGPVEATLLLSLATLRSERAVPRLVLPPEVERVRLEVDLGGAVDEPADYVAYAAALHDAAGGEVWSGEGLAPDRDGVLRLGLPAAALAAGHYELAVRGLTADGTVEDLGFPELEIARP